ncbi:MAG: hypothetical protein MUQ10_14775 [Anaerolineae bacterium]|nr:hypothetical protein [Anaerolineae bacterium]
MRKIALVVVGLLVVLAAGCRGATSTPTSTPELPTSVPATHAPVATPLAVATPAGPASCVAAPMEFSVVSAISEVTEEDHLEGSANARITLIEYADFQ